MRLKLSCAVGLSAAVASFLAVVRLLDVLLAVLLPLSWRTKVFLALVLLLLVLPLLPIAVLLLEWFWVLGVLRLSTAFRLGFRGVDLVLLKEFDTLVERRWKDLGELPCKAGLRGTLSADCSDNKSSSSSAGFRRRKPNFCFRDCCWCFIIFQLNRHTRPLQWQSFEHDHRSRTILMRETNWSCFSLIQKTDNTKLTYSSITQGKQKGYPRGISIRLPRLWQQLLRYGRWYAQVSASMYHNEKWSWCQGWVLSWQEHASRHCPQLADSYSEYIWLIYIECI